MIVNLKYSYTIKQEDGVGTYNDACITAIRRMQWALWRAESSDDVINVFEHEVIEESE